MTLPSRLLVVTDRGLSRRPLPDALAACVEAGLSWIWIRDRDLDRSRRRALALALRQATGEACALTVGADVDLAAELNAIGVHLPAGADLRAARGRLGRTALIGVSAHDEREIGAALGAGADYATLSPIFSSQTKPGYGPPLGCPALARAAALGLPVVALGGVTPQSAASCLRAGAAAVAVMGGVLSAPDPAAATRAYLDACAAAA